MALQTLRSMASGRHQRPDRRRLRALLHRRGMDGAALREDALRQRAARPRVPARLAGVRRSDPAPHRRGDARLGAARDDRPRGRLLLGAGCRLRGRRGQVLRVVAATSCAPCSATTPTVALAWFGASERGNFEGANILESRGAEPPPEVRERIRAALLAAREPRVRPGLDDKRLTAWNALDDQRAGRGRRGARARRLPRRRAPRRGLRARRRCATTAAACCAPTTPARRSSTPTSRTTRSCSRRC